MSSIQLLANDLASRVPAMAQDCAINNATVIEREIEAVLAENLRERDALLRECLDVLEITCPFYSGDYLWQYIKADELAAKLDQFLRGPRAQRSELKVK